MGSGNLKNLGFNLNNIMLYLYSLLLLFYSIINTGVYTNPSTLSITLYDTPPRSSVFALECVGHMGGWCVFGWCVGCVRGSASRAGARFCAGVTVAISTL